MDKSKLLACRMPQGQVQIEGLDEPVTVRGLSRQEFLNLYSDKQEGLSGPKFTEALVSLGMVDPEMTVDEVAEWSAATTFNEIEAVAEKILALSGVKEDAAKAAYKSTGDRSHA
jgi:hypothetical protein